MIPTYRNPTVLHALGLEVKVVRKYGEQAWWAACRECGAFLLALACTDCGWDLGQLALVANHVRALRDVRNGLRLFKCPRGCNSTLCDDPPREVLIAQAEEAAANDTTSARKGTRPRRSRRAAAR